MLPIADGLNAEKAYPIAIELRRRSAQMRRVSSAGRRVPPGRPKSSAG